MRKKSTLLLQLQDPKTDKEIEETFKQILKRVQVIIEARQKNYTGFNDAMWVYNKLNKFLFETS